MAHSSWVQTGQHILEALGGIGGATALLTYGLKRRSDRNDAFKSRVDIANSLTATAMGLLEPVKAAIAEGEKRVHELETTIASLSAALADSEARSRAEREDLQRRLAEAEAERDRLVAELARRDAEMNGMPRPAPGITQGDPI
jgi:hypothetical protein